MTVKTKKQNHELPPTIKRGPKRKYRIDLMDVGDSEVFRTGYIVIYGCIRHFCKAGGGYEHWKFVIRKESPKRTRVWRVM